MLKQGRSWLRAPWQLQIWLSPEVAFCRGVSESHTSTCEWQDFEARMRWRRADHCLLRASAALDAASPEVAERALHEARDLCPAHPLLPEVAGRLRATRDSSSPALAPPHPRLWAAILLAWLLAATVLIR